MLSCTFGQRLVGSLDDTLRTYVNPAARGHLAVHDEAQGFQLPKVIPGGPGGNQVGVGDQHPRDLGGRLEDSHRFARLDQKGLVIFKPAQGFYDCPVTVPVPGRLAAAAVHNKVLPVFGYLRVEVVHEHSQGSFLLPALA